MEKLDLRLKQRKLTKLFFVLIIRDHFHFDNQDLKQVIEFSLRNELACEQTNLSFQAYPNSCH